MASNESVRPVQAHIGVMWATSPAWAEPQFVRAWGAREYEHVSDEDLAAARDEWEAMDGDEVWTYHLALTSIPKPAADAPNLLDLTDYIEEAVDA